jgi:hypothetical protein
MSGRLSLGAAAQELGVSERTLRRHIAAGKIEAVKDPAPGSGGSWFIERAIVEALSRRPPKEDADPADEMLPQTLVRLLKRVDELEECGAALEERIACLEREWDAPRAPDTPRVSSPSQSSEGRGRWPFRRKKEDGTPE